MYEFALSQETLKLEVRKLKDNLDEFLIALQSLVEERENEELLVISVGHHNTILQLQDTNHPPFHHPRGQWYLKSCTRQTIFNLQSSTPKKLNKEKYFKNLKNDYGQLNSVIITT